VRGVPQERERLGQPWKCGALAWASAHFPVNVESNVIT
jgi:hypothetical protein